MNNKEAIFIFTNDRPETLKKTLDSIQHVSYKKYIIDDSVKSQNQENVLELCNHFSNCNYLGKVEFNMFVNQYHIEFPKYAFLLREVGSEAWNLGYSKNFALLYAKSLGLEKTLFMNDEIEIPNLNTIEELFQSIGNDQNVLANRMGLVDDSVFGHIANDLGIQNERLLSGGMLVFNLNKIENFFLNNYNDDWICFFLQFKDQLNLKRGEVFQNISASVIDDNSKIIFQDFGDKLLDGVLKLRKEGSYDSLVQNSFWDRMIIERESYLDLLLTKSIEQDNKKYIEIISMIKSNSKYFNADVFSNMFRNYFKNRLEFQNLFNSI